MGNSGTRRHPGVPCAYNQLAHMYTFIVTNMEEPGHWQVIDYCCSCGRMGLEGRMKQPVGLLSGGQRQELTLLMATVVTPELLLLDEHTAALDPATAQKMLGLTRRIVEGRKATCLMVTHNMQQAGKCLDSDRILLA